MVCLLRGTLVLLTQSIEVLDFDIQRTVHCDIFL